MTAYVLFTWRARIMARHRQIYWVTPSTIASAFLIGLLLICGHHLFYTRLAGRPAPPGYYQFAVGRVSKQQLNTAVGTAFAFLVRSTLALAVAASYTQVLWRVLKTSTKGARLADVDAAFSMLQNVLGRFRLTLWTRHSWLLPVAVIYWLIPIPTIITPATLSIQSAPTQPKPSAMMPVPQSDFVNLNFANMANVEFGPLSDEPSNQFEYQGPSQLVQRVAAATAAQGEILAILPPMSALNASWSLEFWGPSIRCNDVAEPNRSQILNNYGAYLQDDGDGITGSLDYFAWTPYLLPFFFMNNMWSLSRQDISGSTAADSIYIAVDDPRASSSSYVGPLDNETVQAHGGWPGMLVNMTLLACDLFNSSYVADFVYINGRQSITVAKDIALDVPLVSTDIFVFPLGPQQSWNMSKCNDKTYTPYDCYDPTIARVASYQAIRDAFTLLLTGKLDQGTGFSTSFITRTILMDTDDLAFVSNDQVSNDYRANETAFQTLSFVPLLDSRGPLTDALETLFQNITISLLSEPFLL